MGTKHNDRCLDKAADDEPIFVLRSQDRLGPDIVRIWAALAEEHGCPADKIQEARDHALRMEQYAADNYQGGKYPD